MYRPKHRADHHHVWYRAGAWDHSGASVEYETCVECGQFRRFVIGPTRMSHVLAHVTLWQLRRSLRREVLRYG